jgi:hypothetical protein
MENRFDPNQPVVTQAYEAARAELEAMRPEEVEPIRHEIMAAMFTALGIVPKLRALREAARAKFGDEAVRVMDRLDEDARACGKAHALHLLHVHGTDVEVVAARLSQLRTVLLLEVQALIAIGALPAVVVAELVGGTSYKGLCLDVLQLTSALRNGWADVEAQTGVTLLDIDQAEALANQLSTVIGENEQGTASSPTADMRRRAYTRFIRTYNEVRRLVTFLRWEAGDADEIAPSLFTKGKSDKGDDDGHDEIHGASDPSSASPTNGAAPVAPGHPGGSPFVSS